MTGYDAPELVMNDMISVKSDVYSFGVVLLELLCRQRAIDLRSRKGSLVEWIKPYLESRHRICSILDKRLQGKYSKDRVHKVAILASRCLSTNEKLRPNMDEVVVDLEQLQEP